MESEWTHVSWVFVWRMQLPGNFRSRYRSNSWIPEYFRRMVKPKQMDIDFAMYQMFYLCVAPRKVYVPIIQRRAPAQPVLRMSERVDLRMCEWM